MKTTIAIGLIWVSSLALLAQGPRGGGFGGRGAGVLGAGPGRRTLVTGAPYSATETLVLLQTLAGGNQISQTVHSTIYRDSQGRVRTEEMNTPPASSGKAPFTIVTIFDPVAGNQYVLDSSTMIARQMPLPRFRGTASTAVSTPPARPNTTTTDLGTLSINGVAARGTQITETIPAGAIGNAQPIVGVRTTWISIDLKVPVQIKRSDPRFGSTDMELTNIAQVEPNPSLFIVPAGYTIQQSGRGGPGPQGASGRRGSNGADRRGPQTPQ